MMLHVHMVSLEVDFNKQWAKKRYLDALYKTLFILLVIHIVAFSFSFATGIKFGGGTHCIPGTILSLVIYGLIYNYKTK